MARPGPRSVRKYSDEFKLTAVRLSQRPGIQVRTVATSLAIHPVLLSRWRTDARAGRLSGRAPKAPRMPSLRELAGETHSVLPTRGRLFHALRTSG